MCTFSSAFFLSSGFWTHVCVICSKKIFWFSITLLLFGNASIFRYRSNQCIFMTCALHSTNAYAQFFYCCCIFFFFRKQNPCCCLNQLKHSLLLFLFFIQINEDNNSSSSSRRRKRKHKLQKSLVNRKRDCQVSR